MTASDTSFLSCMKVDESSMFSVGFARNSVYDILSVAERMVL